jgi:glutaredoxin 2
MILYIYEHCPFCVRPRLIADIKSINLQLRFLANDNEDEHFRLVGKKIVPILEINNNDRMIESLEICKFIDEQSGDKIIKPSNCNLEINSIMTTLIEKSKLITHPRQIFHPMNIKDFPSESSKSYFRFKKEKSIGMTFERALSKSNLYAKDIQNLLNNLSEKITSKFLTSDNFSMDDLIYFPVLRSLTIALDVLVIPPKIQSYLNFICGITKIKLYEKHIYSNQIKK